MLMVLFHLPNRPAKQVLLITPIYRLLQTGSGGQVARPGHEGGMKGIDQDSLRAGRGPPPTSHKGVPLASPSERPRRQAGSGDTSPPTQVEATPAEPALGSGGGRCRPR